MGAPIVVVPAGGLPVTIVTNGFGTPMTIATNGYGIPVTVVASGGLPVSGFTTGPDVTAPVIVSSNTISWPENELLSHTLIANEPVTWAKVGGADAAKFTLTGFTLTLPPKDYETPDDADANRTYVVQVRATDLAANPSAIQTITVTITNIDEVAPTITSAATFSTPENAAYNHALTANETVTWSIVGGADAAQFSIESGSTLRLAAQDYEAGTSRVVQVRATDTAGNQTNQTITATITDVSEGGGITLVLTWTSANTVLDPVFNVDFVAEVGDILTLEVDDSSGFGSLYDSEANTLDSAEVAAGTITYSGFTTLLSGVTYYARVKLERGATTAYSNTETKTMAAGGDVTAPTIVSYSPADNATGVATNATLIVTFNEPIVFGASSVILKKTSNNFTIEAWSVVTEVGSGAGKVEIIGNAMHMHLTTALEASTEYYLTWVAGVVKDTAGNNCDAQSSTTAWSFTTAAAAGGATWTFKSAPPAQDLAFGPFTASFASVPINNASTSDVVIVFVSLTVRQVTGVTISGNAMTMVVSSNATSGHMSIWKYTGAIFTTPTIVVDGGAGLSMVGISAGVLAGANPVETDTSVLAAAGTGVPTTWTATSVLDVPSGGVGLVCFGGAYNGDLGNTYNVGTREALTYVATGDKAFHSSGYMTATGTPSISTPGGNVAGIASAAWGP